MRIICEYCGAQFDSATNKACPHCGASFEGNDTIEAEKAKQQKLGELEVLEQQMELKERQSQMEYAAKQRKQRDRQQRTAKIGCVIPAIIIIIVGIIFTVFIVSGVYKGLSEQDFFYDDNDMDSDIVLDMIEDMGEMEPEKVTAEVDFNEVADMGSYTFVCDKVEKTDRGVFKPTKGYMYVSFHLVIKNTGEEKIYPFSSVVCSVDGVVCEESFLSDQKDFRPSELPVGLSADGYVCFEVPENAESFELRYEGVDDSSVTISVKNTLS